MRDGLRGGWALPARARRCGGGAASRRRDSGRRGAILEEMAARSWRCSALGETVWSPGEASAAGADIDAYEEFRAAAETAEPGDFPEIGELSDGGLL